MRLRGEIGYAGLAYNAVMAAQGEDLRVASIELEAESQASCDQDDMIARLQCQANLITNGGAARALASGLTNYYQGQPFHYSTGNRPLRFMLGDVEFAADLQALKSSSRGATFNEDGRATIRRLGTIGATCRTRVTSLANCLNETAGATPAEAASFSRDSRGGYLLAPTLDFDHQTLPPVSSIKGTKARGFPFPPAP